MVVVAWRGPVGSWRDHRGFARGRQRLKDPLVGVERLVGDQRIGFHHGQQVVCADQVVCLTAGQEEADWVAQRVDQGVNLGAQSAARVPDRLVLSGFMDGPPLSIGRRLRLGAKERTDGQRTDCRDWDRPGQEQL